MRRFDGRLVIAGIVGVGLVFVLLNVLFGGGQKGVRELTSPSSAPAVRGITYPVRLLSRCAPAVDFDGSFWAPRGGWTLEQPADPGTIELLGTDRALLVTRSRQRITLVRYPSPLRLAPCSSQSP